MKPSAKTNFGERIGRTLGRMGQGCARLDRNAGAWLVTRGLPVAVATALLWIVKLAIFAVLLFVAFWFALLLLFGIVAAWVVRNSGWEDEDKPKWREGHSGFGLYDKNEWRHDMGDPDEP